MNRWEHKRRILVIEDELELQKAVVLGLQMTGYDAIGFANPIDALNYISKNPTDLVILDVMLPGMDGFGVGEILNKKFPDSYVLYLTARNQIEDKLRGLSLGDDYLTKPFSLEELFARLETIFKRANRAEINPTILNGNSIVLNTQARLCYVNDKRIDLTVNEFNLVKILLQNKGMVLSKDFLLLQIDREGSISGENLIETYVSKIRKKSGEKNLIRTKHGIGYYIE